MERRVFDCFQHPDLDQRGQPGHRGPQWVRTKDVEIGKFHHILTQCCAKHRKYMYMNPCYLYLALFGFYIFPKRHAQFEAVPN